MRLAFTLVILLTGSMLVHPTATPKQKAKRQNGAPTIKSFKASTASLCARLPGCSNIPDSRTTLTTIASDPDGDVLTYSYSVRAGNIEGTGPTVVWNLEKQGLGTYSAVVTVKDPKGNKARASVIVKAGWCALCDPPPCPVISVYCPSEIETGKQVTFVADVSGSATETNVSYRWNVNEGKIVDGKFDAKLTVDLQRSRSEAVTATVIVGGYERACMNTASCTVRIKQ